MKAILQKFVQGIETLSSNTVLYFLAMAAAVTALLVASLVLNIGFVTFDGHYPGGDLIPNLADHFRPKEVGYVSALNWSIAGFALIIASCAFLKAIAAYPTCVEALVSRSMFVSPSGKALTERDLGPAQSRYRLWSAGFALVIALLVIAYSLAFDLPQTVLSHLRVHSLLDIDMSSTSSEFDWSISCLFHLDYKINCTGLTLFDVAAYAIIPGMLGGTAFATFVYVLVLSTFTFGTSGPKSPFQLLPDFADASDERRGFQELEPLFESMTVGLGFSLIALYLMSIQNIYLREPEESLFAYVATLLAHNGDVLDKIFDGDVLGGLRILFSHPGGQHQNSNSTIGMAVAMVICTGAGVTFYWTLRAAAQQACRRGMVLLAKRLSTTRNASAKKAIAAQQKLLENMKFWPLKWASLSTLCVVAGLMTAGVVFPSLVSLVLLGVLTITILLVMKKFKPADAN